MLIAPEPRGKIERCLRLRAGLILVTELPPNLCERTVALRELRVGPDGLLEQTPRALDVKIREAGLSLSQIGGSFGVRGQRCFDAGSLLCWRLHTESSPNLRSHVRNGVEPAVL